VRWETKNTCSCPIRLVISVPKIFVNGQFYSNFSSKMWPRYFWKTVHACLCCVFEAQRFVGGKSVFVQFYPPVSFEAIARDLWDLVYEGWYLKADVPGLSTVTRSYLSQTDRASAAHTIR